MTDLERALANYQNALTQLEPVPNPPETDKTSEPSSAEPPAPDPIIAVLFCRDRIQALLEDDETETPSPDWFQKLYDADRQLEEHTEQIASAINLEKWQKTRSADEAAWWWTLTHQTDVEKFEWAFEFISLASLMVALGIAVDTSAKLFSGGIGLISSVSVGVQSVLAIFSAKGALTNTGKAGLEQLFEKRQWPKQHLAAARAGISLGIMTLLILSRGLLPNIARQQVKDADRHFQAGRFSQARSLYTQALGISPDNFEAQYQLGYLYEEIDEIEKAIAQYQIVVQTQPEVTDPQSRQTAWLNAANNLGRLQILNDESNKAVVLLTRGINFVLEVKQARQQERKDLQTFELAHYKLLKNRGWARLKQERYDEARGDLNDAIGRAPIEPDAHCLLAEVSQAEKNDRTTELWANCQSMLNSGGVTPAGDIDRDRWAGLAKRALSSGQDN
jgi:tetratricopeptide (TPR) repeat protein